MPVLRAHRPSFRLQPLILRPAKQIYFPFSPHHTHPDNNPPTRLPRTLHTTTYRRSLKHANTCIYFHVLTSIRVHVLISADKYYASKYVYEPASPADSVPLRLSSATCCHELTEPKPYKRSAAKCPPRRVQSIVGLGTIHLAHCSPSPFANVHSCRSLIRSPWLPYFRLPSCTTLAETTGCCVQQTFCIFTFNRRHCQGFMGKSVFRKKYSHPGGSDLASTGLARTLGGTRAQAEPTESSSLDLISLGEKGEVELFVVILTEWQERLNFEKRSIPVTCAQHWDTGSRALFHVKREGHKLYHPLARFSFPQSFDALTAMAIGQGSFGFNARRYESDQHKRWQHPKRT
ncbi:unnamed protein product [Protopolystoma xenopodis]|uniref:Uncharacterized protein n=1 Tax=Protopolystoma xenopodis TaxID=117903 RepID=A0A3S5CU80_9PLAT|nr:unnamed protein product [Protopolystoma xenopodis]